MADFFTGRQLIVDRLKAGPWTHSALPADRLVFENQRLEPGDSPAPFVMVEIVAFDDAAYAGRPANRLNRADGQILLHLFVPSGEGDERLALLYRDARTILAHQGFDGVQVQGLSAGGGRPVSEDGNYAGLTATAEFWFHYYASP